MSASDISREESGAAEESAERSAPGAEPVSEQAPDDAETGSASPAGDARLAGDAESPPQESEQATAEHAAEGAPAEAAPAEGAPAPPERTVVAVGAVYTESVETPPVEEPAQQISRFRRIGVDIVIVIATILAVVALVSVWANRLLFNPNNFANTSTQLLQNPAIRSATATFLVDQLYANENVPGIIRSGLPGPLKPLAGPVAGALRTGAGQAVELALTRPRVQNLWAQANRAADQTFINIVEGRKGAVNVNNGAVSLNLGTIIDNVARQLGIGANLGSKLPASANITIFKSDQLKYLQNGGKALKGLALLLTILVPLLYALAIFLARGRRRRTLMSVGFAIVLAGILGVAARALLQSQIPNALVKDATLRPAVLAVISIETGMLSEIADAFILVGLVLVVAAWFAGPARLAVRARRALAPHLRAHPGGAFGITAAIMLLIFIWQPIPATGKPVGIIVFFLLAMLGTELLRRQTAREFPEAQSRPLVAAGGGRFRRTEPHAGNGASASASGSLPDQLAHLAVLRDDGVLTPEEYDSAKAKLLHA